MATLSILVRVCILGSWVLLSILLLSSYAFVFVRCNCRITCYGWKLIYDFLNGKWKWISYAIKAYLIHDSYLVYVVEALITLTWKLSISTQVHFQPAIRMYTFIFLLYKLLVYRGFKFIVTHARHLGFQWGVHPQMHAYATQWSTSRLKCTQMTLDINMLKNILPLHTKHNTII